MTYYNLKVRENNDQTENEFEIKYLTNYVVINGDLYNSLKSKKYLDNSSTEIKECKYYCINNNNILIKFNSSDDCADEIGYFSDNNIFNHKYLLNYDKTKVENINNIIVENNENIFKHLQNNDYYEIIKDQNNIGFIYKLEDNKNIIIVKKKMNNLEKKKMKKTIIIKIILMKIKIQIKKTQKLLQIMRASHHKIILQ